MKLEIFEFFKNLLDPSNSELKDECFDIFYSNVLPVFVKFLTTSKDAFTCGLVLEILIVCIQSHGCRFKHYIIRNGIFKQLLPLFSTYNKALKLGMVRLLKALVSLNDEVMHMYIVKHDLLAQVFIYLKNNRKENMMLSACLDLLSQIVTKEMQRLIIYIMTKHNDFILNDIHPLIRKIKYKYDLTSSLDKILKRENILPKKTMRPYKKN